MCGGQAVVYGLEAHGVKVAIDLLGIHPLDIYDALVGSPIRHILARHEQGAGFMPDCATRVASKLGIAVVISGPGMANLATAVGDAYTNRSGISELVDMRHE